MTDLEQGDRKFTSGNVKLASLGNVHLGRQWR